jgi:hypothetical protein
MKKIVSIVALATIVLHCSTFGFDGLLDLTIDLRHRAKKLGFLESKVFEGRLLYFTESNGLRVIVTVEKIPHLDKKRKDIIFDVSVQLRNMTDEDLTIPFEKNVAVFSTNRRPDSINRAGIVVVLSKPKNGMSITLAPSEQFHLDSYYLTIEGYRSRPDYYFLMSTSGQFSNFPEMWSGEITMMMNIRDLTNRI